MYIHMYRDEYTFCYRTTTFLSIDCWANASIYVRKRQWLNNVKWQLVVEYSNVRNSNKIATFIRKVRTCIYVHRYCVTQYRCTHICMYVNRHNLCLHKHKWIVNTKFYKILLIKIMLFESAICKYACTVHAVDFR